MPGVVERWLETFMCKQYAKIFEAFGYKTLQSVCQLDLPQLRGMGIGPEHCLKILENVSILRQSVLIDYNSNQHQKIPVGPPHAKFGCIGPASSALQTVALSLRGTFRETPVALQNTIWFLFTMHFGLRGTQEHVQMEWGDVELFADPTGKEYLQFTERQTKTRQGNTRTTRPYQPKMFGSEDPNDTLCPLKVYKAFREHRSAQCLEGDSRMYLTPMRKWEDSDGEIWYRDQPMGKNTIATICKRMFSAAGITGTMNQYSSESNGPGPYVGNNRMPHMNYNQSSNIDMAYQGCYNNQGSYNSMNSQYIPPGHYPASNNYGNSYPNHMYGPINHHGEGSVPMPSPGAGPYPNSCPPNMQGPAPPGPPPPPMNEGMYNSSGNSDPNMMPPYPNGQTQTMGYYSSMINSPLPPSPHQIQGSSPAPTPTPPGRPPGQFAYPGASPLHQQSRTSPISPMMVRSPASVHSNHSVPSSSPGPISPPGVKSPLSVNSSGMMSPNGSQSLRSPNQPMRSPHHNHPLNSPNHMNQSMTTSPLPNAMISPNQPGHFSPPSSVTPMNSNILQSNGPLQSLQKLVMLPEKRVVDPKSVVGDNGTEGGNGCPDGRHCGTESEMNNIDMCGRNDLEGSDCRPVNIPSGPDTIHVKSEQYSPGRYSNRCSETSGSPRRLSEDMKSPQRLAARRKSDRMSSGSHQDSHNSFDADSEPRSRKNSGRSVTEEADISNPKRSQSDCPDGPLESESSVVNVERLNSDSEEVIVDSPMVKVEIQDAPTPASGTETPKKKRGRPFGSKTLNKKMKEKDKVKDSGKGHKGKKKALATDTVVTKKLFVGPTLKINGPKDQPTSCVIVNHQQTEFEKVDKKKHARSDTKERSSAQPPFPDRPLTDAPWVCCLCGRGSTYQSLGDLYGPYFIDGFKSPVLKGEPQVTSPKAMRPKKRKSYDNDSDSEIFLYDYPKKKSRTSTDGKSPKDSKKKSDTSPGPSTSGGGSPKGSPSDPGEAWVHEECAVWAHGVYMVGSKLQGIPEAARVASQTTCSGCKNLGATIGCLQKGCNQKYHYLCAVDKECYMCEENFSLVCPKHKDKKIKMLGSFDKGT